jgi:MerR family redox-sensitive transcriptional activator SoxR
MADAQGLMIGDVASRSGLATSAVRYYERAGLIRAPRRMSGRRVYDDSVFDMLALIELAKDAGFTITETRALLHGFERATPPPQRWRKLATEKLEEIRLRIERAERMREVLQRLLRCRCETLEQCAQSRKRAMAAVPPL